MVNPEEVYRVASPNCPPEFITLALDCCAVNADKRPKMPQVLERLRLIELDVLSRTENDGGEHVGSIQIVKPGRGRAMPDFSRPSDDELTNAEVEEAKVEDEALVALSTMKIDGTGPSDEGKETWRTAQWNESSDITMSSESSCKSIGRQAIEIDGSRWEREELMVVGHKGHLLRSGTRYHDSRSSLSHYPESSNVPHVAVENASVMNNATPHEEGTLSAMTIRPDMSTSPSGNQVMGENSPPAKEKVVSTEGEKADSEKEGVHAQGQLIDTTTPYSPIPPQSQLQSIPSLNTSVVDTHAVHGLGLQSPAQVINEEGGNGDEEEGSDVTNRVMGTHRFSVLNKDLLELHESNPKKGGSKACKSVTYFPCTRAGQRQRQR